MGNGAWSCPRKSGYVKSEVNPSPRASCRADCAWSQRSLAGAMPGIAACANNIPAASARRNQRKVRCQEGTAVVATSLFQDGDTSQLGPVGALDPIEVDARREPVPLDVLPVDRNLVSPCRQGDLSQRPDEPSLEIEDLHRNE